MKAIREYEYRLIENGKELKAYRHYQEEILGFSRIKIWSETKVDNSLNEDVDEFYEDLEIENTEVSSTHLMNGNNNKTVAKNDLYENPEGLNKKGWQ